MSRAFVNEDGAGPDPEYDAACARALLLGANDGDSAGAEAATGYIFGEPKLLPWVRQILREARLSGNDRQEQLAERFLRRAGAPVE